jgi:hypothetical protein
MSSSLFVVRLPGTSNDATASTPTKHPPPQSFVMDHSDFPSVERSYSSPVASVRSENRTGAWSTRPLLPAHHLVPPSPSPSDQAVDELADNLAIMTSEPELNADADPYTVDSAHSADELADDIVMMDMTCDLNADTDPYAAGSAQTALLQELAYYRASAEHWHDMCVQMQNHVAMVCVPLSGPPQL